MRDFSFLLVFQRITTSIRQVSPLCVRGGEGVSFGGGIRH
jgi:hypothetical protein